MVSNDRWSNLVRVGQFIIFIIHRDKTVSYNTFLLVGTAIRKVLCNDNNNNDGT